MSIADTEKFLQDLKASGVASTPAVDEWLAIAKNPNDASKLADLLVGQGNLTRWQANYLLTGRHRLRLGNYVLIDRRKRSRLGDAFIGRHEQLDRLVNILFLTKNVSRRLAENRSLIQELAAAGDVDHPNLERLHLIDQERDRYLLVTDHVNGKSLNDTELLVSLKPTDLAMILRQTMQAMEHLHAKGFSHGNLTEQNLLLDSTLKLTVTNVVESMLVEHLDRNDKGVSTKPKDDIQAIALIGRRLIARLSSHDVGNTTDRVKSIIDRLANSEIGLATAIGLLNSVEQSIGRPANEKNELARSRVADTNDLKPDVDLAVVNQAGHTSKRITAVGKTGTLMGKWLTVSAAVLFAAIAVILIGRSWFGSGSETNRTAQQTESDTRNNELPSRPRVLSEPASLSTRRQPPLSTNRSDVAAIQSPSDSARVESSLPSPVVDLSKLADGDDTAVETDAVDSALADGGIRRTESDRPAEDSESTGTKSIFSAYQTAGIDVDARKDDQGPRAGDLPAQDSDGATESPPGSDDLNPTKTNGGPKSGILPESVDLPPDSNAGVRQLFAIEAIQSTLTLQLVSDKNVSQSKLEFEMSGSPERQWTVQMLDPRNSKKSPVANFSVKNGSLEFNWLEGNQDLANANYLRNCVLRLKWAHGTKAIALRKPMIVEGFRLDREKPQIRLEFPDLEYLPKNTVAELLELDEKIYGTTFLFPEERTDRLISSKNGMEVHFSDLPEFQMVYLVLSSDLRNRARLEAALLLRMIPAQKSRTATTASLDAASNQLEEYFQTVKINHDGLRGMKIDELRRQFNLSSDRFKNEHKLAKVKELKQEMEFSEKRAKSFRELRTRLEAFYERPIPVAIFFEVDGQRVTLATTVTE